MQLKYSICLLILLLALAISTANKRSSDDYHRRMVKRGIWDDITNAFKNLGSNLSSLLGDLKDFSSDKFEEFKQKLSSLDEQTKEDTLKKMKEFYYSLKDKSTTEAERVKEAIRSLGGDVSGSSCVTGSLLTATSLVLLCIAIFY